MHRVGSCARIRSERTLVRKYSPSRGQQATAFRERGALALLPPFLLIRALAHFLEESVFFTIKGEESSHSTVRKHDSSTYSER